MKTLLFLILIIPFSHWSLAQTGSDKPQWIEAGVAVVDITPDQPMALTGYGDRYGDQGGVYDSIVQRLKAKALYIGKNVETSVVIITMDLIGFPASLADNLAGREGNLIAAQASFFPQTGSNVIGQRSRKADQVHGNNDDSGFCIFPNV